MDINTGRSIDRSIHSIIYIDTYICRKLDMSILNTIKPASKTTFSPNNNNNKPKNTIKKNLAFTLPKYARCDTETYFNFVSSDMRYLKLIEPKISHMFQNWHIQNILLAPSVLSLILRSVYGAYSLYYYYYPLHKNICR